MKALISAALVVLAALFAFAQAPTPAPTGQGRIEEMHGKKFMVFSPHPDDDTFCCGGLMALLAKNGNDVRIVLYTNDDKGSFDLEMNSQRLARIRKAEEEAAVSTLGVPKDHVMWMGYNDGELEYVPQREIVERTTYMIREFRPDVVLAVDPGEWHDRWHKSDHRMASLAAIDGVRAAEFHLYFPNQLLQHGLQPWRVPLLLFYYTIPSEENYWVNVDSVNDLKIQAYSKHVSQFPPAIDKYQPDWSPENLVRFNQYWKQRLPKKDGHYVEPYRLATGFNQK